MVETLDNGEVDDEETLLQSEYEIIRRQKFEAILNLQKDNSGLIEPKRDLVILPGMYLPQPVALPSSTSTNESEEQQERDPPAVVSGKHGNGTSNGPSSSRNRNLVQGGRKQEVITTLVQLLCLYFTSMFRGAKTGQWCPVASTDADVRMKSGRIKVSGGFDGRRCPDEVWMDNIRTRARGEDGSPSRGRGDAQERIRPTAFARARRGRQPKQPVQQDVPTPTEEVPQQVVYEGGPQDTSLLRLYESHDRGTLKVITHGRKLRRPENDYVRDIVDDSGLGPLVKVGEMTITLDDVNNLLHIPVHGRFFFLPSLGKDEAKELLVTLLGVSYSDAHEEIEYTRGPSVRLNWLRSVYENKVDENRLSYAARAYLLHLVGCTIFTDKSASNVRVQYLEIFRVLASVGHIAWGAAWILEHFPHVTHGERSPDYVEGMPLSRRLRPHRPVGDVVNVRQYLDWIRHSDIIWTPYILRRAYRPFHDVCWYYGYITSGDTPLPHLPDRVLRQYGHVQSIPPSPHEELPVPPSADVHAHFIHYHDHLLDKSRRGPPVTHAGECTQGYLDWFQQVSHPYIIPHDDKVHDPLPRRVPTVVGSQVGGSQDIPSGTPEDSSH
ncbi:Aminotransferase-like, plant mobile domain [Sesbania bispinosa]|nr:Aminotransferase-like, plant mobile domain [Sesbania bispinosa]